MIDVPIVQEQSSGVLQNSNIVTSVIEQEGDDDEMNDGSNINLPSLSVNSSTGPSLINIYVKQKKDNVVDTIFHEDTTLDLSDIISDIITDRFNRHPTIFTVPLLRCLYSKV
jgi:hypothetical protein